MPANEPARPLSRRAMLTAGTALAAQGACIMKAPSAEPDPILALIEAERRAWEAFGDTIAAQDEASTPAETAEADRLNDEAHEAWLAATRRMVTTVPATAAGLVAVLDRFETYTAGCMVNHTEDGLSDLLATVRAFVSGRAGA